MRKQPSSATRALLIVLGAHSPASTASCIVARHSRTVSTLMRLICMPLKNGSSRFVPWARRSSQEPRVISAFRVAQVVGPIALKALTADGDRAAGHLYLPLASRDQRLVARAQAAAVARAPAGGRLGCAGRAHDDEPAVGGGVL